VTITIADVNETVPDTTPPVITGPSGAAGDPTAAKTINENTSAVATLGANEAVTWSLIGGADQAKFVINASSGALSFIAAPNFELPTDSDGNNAYVVQVRAVDGSGNASTQTVTVTVADVNETIPDTTPPVITGPSGAAGDPTTTKTINENTTAVATLSANEPVTWSLIGGADQAKFVIDASSGALSFIAAPNYELPADTDGNNTYVVQVRAVDGSGNASTQTVTVTIADVNETIPDITAPLITGPSGGAGDATSVRSINENTTAVATLSADEAVTWSLVGGADQVKFVIDPTNGALSFIAAPNYEVPADSDGNNTYVVQVRAVDSSGNVSTQTVTVTVVDVNEAISDATPPLITGPSGGAGDATSAGAINENTTNVATLTANEPVTWSIVGGVDQTKFRIDSVSGALSFIAAPDYEVPTDTARNNSYVVQVRATDGSGNTSLQTVTVMVKDVAEGPVAQPLNDATVEVGSALGPITLPAFKSGEGRPLDYSATLATGMPLPEWLTFNAATRTFTGTPPAGTALSDLTIRVTATDGRLSADSTFVLHLTTPPAPIAANDNAQATEASGIGHAVAGLNPSGNVLANDSGRDVRVTAAASGSSINGIGTELANASVTLTGIYGTLTLTADGTYQYTVDNGNARVVALNNGETLTDSFTYRVTDRAGQTSLAQLSIVIDGVTDELPPIAPLPVAPASFAPTIAEGPSTATTAGIGAAPFTSANPQSASASVVSALGIDSTVKASWALPINEPRSESGSRAFEMAVLPGETQRLVVYRGMPDQFSEADAVIRFSIPPDAFAHEKDDSEVIFSATLMDGSALPGWLVFDRINGTFSGVAPRGFVGELKIKVIARDAKGQQAEALFRFNVGKADRPPHAKVGLSSQMRGFAALNSRFHGLDLAQR
jgi:VCBS repeat-containing protein